MSATTDRPLAACPATARAIALFALAMGLGTLPSGCEKSYGRPWIHKIKIDGAKQVSARDIRGKLALQGASIIPFSAHHYLDHPYLVQVDGERIETYYRARGYYLAKVVKAEIIPYKDGKKPAVDIHYVVEEGPATHVRNVTLTGLEDLGPQGKKIENRILKEPVFKPNAVFEYPQYVQAKEDMQRLMFLKGYGFAKIHNEVDVNRELSIADIKLRIDPGHKLRIGRTTVEGNRLIDAASIIKHAALVPGEDYSSDLLDGAQGKLYNLGVFTSVLVEPVPDPNNPDVANIRIRLSEGKLRELNIGVGFGIEPLRTEIHTEATFTKRSFLGGLRKIEASLRPGYAAVPAFWSSDMYRNGPLLTAKVEFTQPDLLGINSELTASVVYDVGLEYAYQYHGPGAKLGVQRSVWRDHIKLAASYNFQFLDFFNTDPAILGDAGQAGALYGYTDPYRLGYLQEQFVLDLRNRPIDATRGFYFAVLAEEGGAYTGSAFWYEKFVPEARGYVTIGSRVVLAARVQFGQIFTHGDNGSPITQRLYLGGPNSHRGFTFNRLSYQVCSALANEQAPVPTKVDCSTDPNIGGSSTLDFRRLPIGGDQMLLGQFEVRVNLFKLFGQWLSFASFMDAGDVAAPSSGNCTGPSCQDIPYLSAIDLRRLHVAVGGGLRYRTVIGAIRFDLGVRLNRVDFQEADGVQNPDPGQRIAYHISIGEAF